MQSYKKISVISGHKQS